MNTLIHTGTAGLEALIITDEDEVLACGKNEEGCLGLDNEAFQVAPVNIPELEKQKVKGELFWFEKTLNFYVFQRSSWQVQNYC